MHRIIDNKLSGSAKRNLRIFQRMCGQKALQNTVFLTSMWSTPPTKLEMEREEELKQHPCVLSNSMATVARLGANTRKETEGILRLFVGKRPEALDIQIDIVQRGKQLHETDAAHSIDPQLVEEVRAREAQIKAEKERREHMRLEEERQRKILKQLEEYREAERRKHEEEKAREAHEHELRMQTIRERRQLDGVGVSVSVTVPCVIM